jgi:hypothetical protein
VLALGGNTLMNVSQYVTENLAEMRINQDVTHEWARLGMVKGLLLDADGATTILDFFDAFGAVQLTVTKSAAAAGEMKQAADDIVKTVADELGGFSASRIYCLMGNTAFTRFIQSEDVEDSYDKTHRFEQQSYVYREFTWRGVTWVDYRGTVGGTSFIDDDKGVAFPVGPGLYKRYNAPADYMGAANRLGQPMYSSQYRMPHDKGIELEVQSNPLFVPTRITSLLDVTINA